MNIHKHKWVRDRQNVNCDTCFIPKNTMTNKQTYLDKIEATIRQGMTYDNLTRALFLLFCEMHKELLPKEINYQDIFYGKSEIEHGFESAYNKAIDDMRAKIEEMEK